MTQGKLYFVTGNKNKFSAALEKLGPLGFEIEQAGLDIPETQYDSIEEIAVDKAKRAFQELKNPLFVNDSGWTISALNGFPGPYMKFINEWFAPQNFLDLLKGQEDREVILRQVIVYIDDKEIKTFVCDSKGEMLHEARGSNGIPSDRVISLSESGLSIAEEKEQGKFAVDSENILWEDFANWLKEK